MSNQDHLRVTHTPGDTVTLTPNAVAPAYIRRDGEDWIALRIDDIKLGTFMLVVPPEGAAYIAGTLAYTLDHLDEYRDKWLADQGES